MIAVDASAVIAFFLREEGWKDLARYMVRTVSVDHVVKEFYNAVWKATYLRNRLNRRQAEEALRLFMEYLSKNMELKDEIMYVNDSYRIALSTGLTIYDSLYIALAVKENLPLLTLDQRQRAIARKLGISTVP
ncbi:MAG: type II toxin-antitoxin system VapC family toxin [Thermoprotei archaeon]|nr:type II toxin-antitoxin system VapC family toxin [Thermoprotei archaeon]